MVKVISAIGAGGEYANGNALPWPRYAAYARADMAFFRQYTMNKTIIMGYNTWSAIGVLPRRLNIVIGRDYTLDMAIAEHPNAIVIGGLGLLYELFDKHPEKIEEVIINRFHHNFVADKWLNLKKIPLIYREIKGDYYDQLIYFRCNFSVPCSTVISCG